MQDIIVMLFGAVLVLCGLLLAFFLNKDKNSQVNRVNFFGLKIEFANAGLVVFFIGCLIFILPLYLSSRTHVPVERIIFVPGPSGQPSEPKATITGFSEELEEAAAEKVDKAEVYFKAGEYYFTSKEFRNAITSYRESIEALPTMAAYLNLGNSLYYISEYTQADTAFSLGFEISESNQNKQMEGAFTRRIGLIHSVLGEYDKALDWYLKSKGIFEEMDHHRIQLAKIYNNIGLIHEIRKDYNEALKWHFKSLEIKEELKDFKGLGKTHNNIGLVHLTRGDYDAADEEFKEGVRIRERIGDLPGLAEIYTNICILHRKRGNYDKALEYCEKSLKISEQLEQLKDSRVLAATYDEKGKLYKDLGDYDGAIKHFEKSIRISAKIGHALGEAETRKNFALVCIELRRYDQAIKNLTISDSLYRKMDLNDHVKEVQGIIADIGAVSTK